MTDFYPDQNKIHQTRQNIEQQQSVLDLYAKTFGLTVAPESELARQDAKLYNKNWEYVELVEVKCRNNSATLYPTYTVDVDKLDSLNARSILNGVNARLIVSWSNNDIRWLDVRNAYSLTNRCVFPTRYQKRRGRQERADLVYEIPVSAFQKL